MPSIHTLADFAALRQRIERLGPTTQRRWGTMSLAQMLRHMQYATENALGRRSMKQEYPLWMGPLATLLFVDLLPWPHSLPTAADLKPQANPGPDEQPEVIAEEKANLLALLQEAAHRPPAAGGYGVHPIFGKLSGAKWGKLLHKHTDHHLRQFGV